MHILTLIPIAALVLGNVSPSLTGPDGPGQGRTLPDLIRVAGSEAVTADFGTVEYYPNLKSKLGVASIIKDTELMDTGPYLQELGPGLVCSNIEFDLWYKRPGDAVPAMEQSFAVPGDETSRPMAMSDTPARWMTDYERMIGDLSISQLVQLTGAPPQYQQETAQRPAIHPAPTDLEATVALMASWVTAAKHPYPVMWSLWNEPGHALEGLKPALKKAQKAAAPETGKAARKAAKAAERAARRAKGNGDATGIRRVSDSDVRIADIYKLYNEKMRPVFGHWSQFGLASFLSADFNSRSGREADRIYFEEVMSALGPEQEIDFLTFNSYNGAWSVILNGVRALAGGDGGDGPVIFTQYAPLSMKFNNDGSEVLDKGISASLMQVSLDMIDDFVALQRATDVRNVCMSYWFGGAFGFLDYRGSGVQPTQRYYAMKMFMDLPVTRTQLDLGSAGLEAQGLRGLAGRNQGKVAVLLWNQGNKAISVPLTLNGVPEAMQAGAARLTLLDDDNPKPVTTQYQGEAVRLAAHGMALVELTSDSVADPLLRRDAIDAADGKTRFLQTLSFPDRVTETCKRGLATPGADACARNTGTYGFYDSVRSAAYLGMGDGKSSAGVTATYSGLPEQVFAAAEMFSVGEAAPADALRITAKFDACDQSIDALPAGDGSSYLLLDFQSVPATCRAKAATIELRLDGVTAGTQAEVHFGADAAEVQALAGAGLIRTSAPDIDEGLQVVKPRQNLD